MPADAKPTTTSLQIVRVDQGGVNERILAREAKVDYRRVEAASVKMTVQNLGGGVYFVQGESAMGSAANQNFISNAIKYTPSFGAVVLRLERREGEVLRVHRVVLGFERGAS